MVRGGEPSEPPRCEGSQATQAKERARSREASRVLWLHLRINQVRVRTEQGITKRSHILGWKERRYYSAQRSASIPHGTDKNNTEDMETEAQGKTMSDLKRKTGLVGPRP